MLASDWLTGVGMTEVGHCGNGTDHVAAFVYCNEGGGARRREAQPAKDSQLQVLGVASRGEAQPGDMRRSKQK